MRWLIIVVWLVAASCTSALPAPSATPPPTPSPRVTLRTVDLRNGLLVDVPVGWDLLGAGFVNRATQRYLLAGNVDLATLPGVPNNGDVDAAALPARSVVVEIESFCRFGCRGPAEETVLFPLDWAMAAPLYDRVLPSDRHELALGFRWFDLPMYIVARWTDDAPAADVAAIAAIARSLRADPPAPSTGVYGRWLGLGPVTDIPIGTVRLVPLPAGAIVREPHRFWDSEPFFIVRDPAKTYAFSSKPLVDRRCVVAFDAPAGQFRCTVGDRVFAWTKDGKYLGPEPASDMQPLRVIVRGGAIWVAYYD